MARLLVDGKVDPASQVTFKLDHNEGLLTSHVTQVDRTLTYTADIETGNRHYPVVYSTPQVPDGVVYDDGEWNPFPWDFPTFTVNKKYIATQFPTVVLEIGTDAVAR